MWQRIQTVYLILAVIACTICLCLPIAELLPKDLGASSTVFNLWTITPDGSKEFPWWSIVNFVILLFVCTIGTGTIFLYKTRKKQAKLCSAAAVLTIIWMIIFGVCAYSGLIEHNGDMIVKYAACLPFVAMVFFILARRAILKDEALVRSMDRIR